MKEVKTLIVNDSGLFASIGSIMGTVYVSLDGSTYCIPINNLNSTQHSQISGLFAGKMSLDQIEYIIATTD